MSDEAATQSSSSPRPTRARVLAMPPWIAARGKLAATKPGADRPFGESMPVVVALAFCALGVYLTMAAIGRVTAASRPNRGGPARLSPRIVLEGEPRRCDQRGVLS